jgi:phosphoglycerate dehydrogenase-like enzyme
MKAVLHFRASDDSFGRWVSAAPKWLTLVKVDDGDRDRLKVELADAEVLLHVLEPVTNVVMAAAPKLRFIQKIGVGVNAIDLVAARQRNIAVANMPGTNSQAVAEMTLALMLAAIRRLPMLDAAVKSGRGWNLPSDSFDRVGELHGKLVGLVGYGEVPRRLVPVLHALGARTVYHARRPKVGEEERWRSLDELLRSSDIVSLHVPLNEETRHLLNVRTLSVMKHGVVLVNTARGELLDEQTLMDALGSGKVGAAGLDVLSVEPAGEGHPLFGIPNVVLTPHVAWLTRETLDRSFEVALENIRRLNLGGVLLHRVDQS